MTCEQMFTHDALKEQVEWMKKAMMFPSNTNIKEAIKDYKK